MVGLFGYLPGFAAMKSCVDSRRVFWLNADASMYDIQVQETTIRGHSTEERPRAKRWTQCSMQPKTSVPGFTRQLKRLLAQSKKWAPRQWAW